MSLDVYLLAAAPFAQDQTPQIWVREDGQTRQITAAEWEARFPDRAPITVTPHRETTVLYHANVTHNLTAMAQAAGLYGCLWRPDEEGLTHAADLLTPLREGLAQLQALDPAVVERHTPANGWGTYAQLVDFVGAYVAACALHPEARVEVSR